MTIYYTARAVFANDYDEDGLGWEGYRAWRNLPHLTEVVSLDCLLNKNLVPYGQNNFKYSEFPISREDRGTNFYESLDFVLKCKEPRERFNLLAVAIEPEEDCRNVKLNDFEFIGYDLLDDWYSISTLTNCGCIIPPYMPADLNQYALLNNFTKAYEVQASFLRDYSGQEHMDTRVIGIWRNMVYGR